MTFADGSYRKDHGLAWLVCFAGFLIHAIGDGLGMCFGVLVPYIKENFDNSSTSAAAFVGSLRVGLFLSAPLYVTMAKTFGFRKVALIGSIISTVSLLACGVATSIPFLAIAYGLMSGIGACMVITVSELAVNQSFEKKRSLANAIVFSGTSLGYFTLAPVLSNIVEEYGIEAGFIAEGCLTIFCILSGLLLASPSSSEPVEDQEIASKTDLLPNVDSGQARVNRFLLNILETDVICHKGFQMYIAGRIFNYLPLIVPLIYIPSMMLEFNRTTEEGSLAITIIGICNLFGRLTCGILDKFPNALIKVNAWASLSSGVLLATMPHCKDPFLMYVVCGLYGWFTAPCFALSPSIMARLVGSEKLDFCLGANIFIFGSMSLAGPPVIGLLFDYYKSFSYPFYYAAASFSVSFVFHSLSELYTN